MGFFDSIGSGLKTLGLLRLKGRFVFRCVNPGGGLFNFPGNPFGGGGIFILPLNPQRFRISRPMLKNTQVTEGGVYRDDFNMGVQQIAIAGHFGFEAKPQWGSGGLPLLGMDHLNLLQDLIVGYYSTAREVKAARGAFWEFYDLADLYFMQVAIDDFTMTRVVNEPWLHFYELRMTILQDYFSAGALIPRIPFDQIPGLGTMSAPELIGKLGSAIGGLL